MRLELADSTVANATPLDVEQAFARPIDADWQAILVAKTDDSLEAAPDGRGFMLEVSENNDIRVSVESVDAATAKAVLVSYLLGDDAWRTRVTWVAQPTTSSKHPTPQAALRVGLMVLGALVAIYALSFAPFVADLPEPLNDTRFWPLALIFLTIPGLIVFVVVKRALDVRRAASWSSAQGRILTSRVATQDTTLKGAPSDVRNVPFVEYDFVADGHHVTGTRISLGEDAGLNADATVARYPVGAAVTVYYNPKAPAECVLERDAPAPMGKILAVVLLLVFVGIPLALYGFRAAYRGLESELPNGSAAFVLFFAAAGSLVLLSTFANRILARRASAWPVAPGRIVASRVESYESASNHSTVTYYQPAVEYAYTVNGREFHGRRLDFGARVGSSQASAQQKAAVYPMGLQVQVHYDPSNPSEAVLQTRAGSSVLALILGFGLLAAAYVSSGLGWPH